MVQTEPSDEMDQFWPAQCAIPWTCFAWPDVIDSDGIDGTHETYSLAMLARHWGFLRGLGLPTPPHVSAIPNLLLQTREDGMDADSEEEEEEKGGEEGEEDLLEEELHDGDYESDATTVDSQEEEESSELDDGAYLDSDDPEYSG